MRLSALCHMLRVTWCCPSAGYMQWKQLLVLFLGCISGPFETHTQLFISLLTALTAQLQLGLGIGGHSTADTSGATAAAGDASGVLLAGGLVDELLPDSFLRSSFRGFFEVLQESSDTAPAALLAQVGAICQLLFLLAKPVRLRILYHAMYVLRSGGCSV